MQIGVAHAAGHDPHKHFVGEWRREVESFDLDLGHVGAVAAPPGIVSRIVIAA